MTGSLLAKANQAGLPDCVTQAGNPVRGTSEACSNAGFFNPYTDGTYLLIV